MRAKWIVTAGVAAVLMAGAGQAAAQQMIDRDGTVSGTLDGRDPVSSTGGRFDRWRVEASPGELIVLRMNSNVIDPVVQIGRTGPGGQFYELASDDDGAGYPNSLLQFRAAEGGQYEVRATSYSEEERGGYSLSRSSQWVSTGDQSSVGGLVQLPLDVGGYIDLDDPVDVDGRHYEAWRILIPNQRVVRIRQESADMDSYVMLGVIGASGEWIGLFHDDDSGGELNSEFVYQSVAEDTFEVRASTYSPGATGSYRLIVEDVSAAPEGGMSAGMITGGWLTETDNPDVDGRFIEYRTFYAFAGQTVTATLRSDEFDAYLRIGQWNNGFHEITFDDDSGGGETGYDAQATFVAPHTGLYTAALTSFGAGEIGLFSFEVQAY